MNYGIKKIEGQNYIPLEHAAFLSHVSAAFLSRLIRSGELFSREIKDQVFIDESSLQSYLLKREHTLRPHFAPSQSLETHSSEPVNISQNIDIPSIGDMPVRTHARKRFSHAAMSISEAALVAGLSANYIGKLARAGEMKTAEEHGETRIDRHSLNAFMKAHARRLEERREKLARERLETYAKSAPVVPSPYPTPVLSEVEVVVSGRWLYARQIAILAAVAVIGSGIVLLDHSDTRFAAAAGEIQAMTASAADSASGALPGVLSDLARAVNTNVNSLFASIFGSTSNENVATTKTLAPIDPTPEKSFIARAATAATSTPTTAPAPAPIIHQTIVQQPVIERIVQTQPVFGGVSQQSFDEQLQALDNKLSARMYGLSSANSNTIAQNYVVTAQTNAIDQLTNTRINNPSITGGSISGTDISAQSLSVSGGSLFGNVLFANATTTNLAVTGALSLGNTTVNGDLTLTGALNFSGSSSTINASGGTFVNATSTNGYFSGLTAGFATTTGNQYIGGNLTVGGDSITLGTSTSNMLYINSAISSNLVPSGNKTLDLGSPSYFWRNAYIDTLNVNNLSAASSSIGGTQSETFTINTDNATVDTQDMNLIFYRGTVVPNAVISWNSATNAKRFEFNQSTFFQNQSGSTTQSTLTLKGVSGQTGNLFSVASSSGTTVFAVGPNGTVTSATSTATNLSVTGLATSTFAGALSVGGNFNFNGAILQNGAPFISSQWITSGSDISFTGGKVGIGTASPNNPLDVAGTASVGIAYTNLAGHALMSVNGASASQAGYYIYKNGVEKAQIAVLGGSNDLSISMAGTDRLHVAAGGNVGVGNTSPSYLLDVAGTGRFTGTVDADHFVATSSSATTLLGGNLTVNGNTLLANATSTNLFSTTASSTNLFAASATVGILRITGGYLSQASSTVVGNFTSTGIVSGASFTGAGTGLTGTAASLSVGGNAGTATALQTSRTINNVGFNGTGDITISAASSTLLANNNTFSGSNSFTGSTALANTTLTNATSTALTVTGVTSALHLGNALGQVTAYTGSSCTNQFVRSLNGAGVATCATVSLATDVTGTLLAAQFPALTGDITTSAGSLATALKNTGTAGTYRSVTTDAQGRVTAGTNPTTFAGYAISDSSANLAAALTDKTGTGSNVFAVSPTLSGTLTAAAANFSGNVGIGTTTPQTNLEVAGGTLRVSGLGGELFGTTGSGLELGYNTSSNTADIGAFTRGANTYRDLHLYGSNINLDTGGASRLYVNSSGNVGIGTTTPVSRLSVYASATDQIRLGNGASPGEYGIGRNNANGQLTFFGYQSGATSYSFGGVDGTRMTIDTAGNVGIGINPGSPLSVFSGLTGFGQGNAGGIVSNFLDGNTRNVMTIRGGVDGTTLPTNAVLNIGGNGSQTYSINAVSNVFIGGNTFTGNVFQKTGNVIYPGRIDATTDYQSSWYLASHGSFGLFTNTGFYATGQIWAPSFVDANDGSYYVDPNGQTILNLLNVADLSTFGSPFSSAGYYVCRDGTTGQFLWATSCDNSDQRLKTNVTDLSQVRGLAAVDALRPVTFDWLDATTSARDGHQIGFIAQDVQKVFPEFVVAGTATTTIKLADGSARIITSPLGLDYQKLTVPLVEAVQEIDARFLALSSSAAPAGSTIDPNAPEVQSYAASFFHNLFVRVTAWFADAGNGIGKLFAKEVHTDKICVSRSDGTEFCANGDQLAAAMAAVGSGGSAGSGSVVASPPQTPAPSSDEATTTDSVIIDSSSASSTPPAGN